MGLVVEDPQVVTSEEAVENTVIAYSADGSTNYKVANTDDPSTKVDEDSNELLFDGNIFGFDRCEPADEFEFEDDEIILKYSGGSMRNIARTLDQNGAVAADVQRDGDGRIVLSSNNHPIQNDGLFEYSDADDGPMPRLARATVARDDLVGEEVYVFLRRLSEVDEEYSGDAYWTSLFGAKNEETVAHTREALGGAEPSTVEMDGQDLVEVLPRTGDIPTSAIIETGWLEWSYGQAVDELNEAGVEPGTSAARSSDVTTTGTDEGNEDSLTVGEVGAIDQIEEALAGTEDLTREDIETVVHNNEGHFDRQMDDADLESATDELEGRLLEA
jgi:hypothetical protein